MLALLEDRHLLLRRVDDDETRYRLAFAGQDRVVLDVFRRNLHRTEGLGREAHLLAREHELFELRVFLTPRAGMRHVDEARTIERSEGRLGLGALFGAVTRDGPLGLRQDLHLLQASRSTARTMRGS